MNKKRTCNICKTEIEEAILNENYSICPKCGNYLEVMVGQRINTLADPGSFREWSYNKKKYYQCQNNDYIDKLIELSKKYNLDDAITIGEISINRVPVAIGVMDTRFMMASMGAVVGEKVTRLFEKAAKKELPVILFCCSGGARLQEGIISLMQMVKTSIAVEKHNRKGLLYISILTNPTLGGVTASFATLADIVLAEKNATIGFAGSRVVEQNTKVKLPKDIQSAELKLENGLIDEIVCREELKEKLEQLLSLHRKNKKCKTTQGRIIYSSNHIKLDVWEKVKQVRSFNRPTSKDFIEKLFDSFVELKGDRVSGDDHAIIGGIASFHGRPVTVIGQEKGKKTLEDSIYRNWGMPLPCGYRKALRLMKQAEKFNRPIVCLVDTIGAACGKEAEEGGQASVIASVLREVSNISVPILSIIIGEAYSGGALALCLANEIWMLENALYSILSPEGYASILWKDNSKAENAAVQMKMEAEDLYKVGIIDKVIEEPNIMNRENMSHICKYLDNEMARFLTKYDKKTKRNIVVERKKRYRKY